MQTFGTPTAPVNTAATPSATSERSGFSHPNLSRHWVPRERRISAFHKMGKPYDPTLSIEANLAGAGMGEPVRLLPAPIDLGGGNYMPTKNQHIVITQPGKGPLDEPRLTSMGVVAGKWKPLQMPDFIRKFEFLLDKFPPHHLINTGGGRVQGLMLQPAQLPKPGGLNEDIEVGYLLLNDYSGKGSITIRSVTMRLVCTNGMTAMHLGKIGASLSCMRIPHTERGLIDLSERAKLLRDLQLEPAHVAHAYEILAKKHVTKDVMVKMVDAVHKMPKKPVILLQPAKHSAEEVQSAQEKFEATQARIRNTRQIVHALHEYENDTAVPMLRGSAWLGWQALVEEADYNHYAGQPATTVPMFLGAGAKEQETAFKMLLSA